MNLFDPLRRSLAAALILAVGSFLAGPGLAAGGKILYACENLETKSPLSTIGVQVYQGEDGWFARAGDLESMYEYPSQTLRMLSRLNEVLRSKGTHLILLPMLPRGIAGRNFLPEGGLLSDRIYDANFSASQFDALIASIRAEGVTAVNINQVLENHPDFDRDKYYFKRDIHWTPEAAELVAGAVAEQVRQIQPENPSPVQFETTKAAGSKLIQSNLNKSLNELCQDKIPAEEANLYETKQNVDSLDSLLGDENTQEDHSIQVVGTSFTDEVLVFHFNGFLRQALGQNVDGFSLAGGGVTQSFYGWANSEIGAGRRPKVLIWEFNNPAELIGVTPYLAQVLTPAVMGDCAAQDQAASAEFKDASKVSFDISAAKAAGPNHYLRYDFSNRALREFKLKFNFANGESQIAVVENPSRVQDIDTLHHELPDDAASPVKSVEMEIVEGGKSSGTVKLCKYPANVFADTGTSN